MSERISIMKLSLSQATEAMVYDGYIDFEREEYLYPKWWYEENKPEYDGMTAEECAKICAKDAQASKRYLRVNVINGTGSVLDACTQLGISKEQLIKLGADKEEYWSIYTPPVTDHNKGLRKAAFTDEERKIYTKILDYLWEQDLYITFVSTHIKTLEKYTKKWMNAHGITVIDDHSSR